MFAFNNDVEGTERLGNLPHHLRSSLLEVIYARMLSSCELLQAPATTRQTALMLCQYIQPQVSARTAHHGLRDGRFARFVPQGACSLCRRSGVCRCLALTSPLSLASLSPQVCLAKQCLVERNSIATHLFLLYRGTLHVTLGEEGQPALTKQPSRKGDKGSPPPASRKASGPHTKGKAMLRVRVCERMGAFVGIYDPYDITARLPLEVTAVKISQLFAIQRHDLIDVMEAIGEKESSTLQDALRKEQKTVLEALKYNRPERATRVTKSETVTDANGDSFSRVTVGGSPGGQRLSASPGGQRASAGESGGEVVVPRNAVTAAKAKRRASVVNATVGSLLSGGSGGAVATGVNEAAASAVANLWDDAVHEVKDATRSLEGVALDYKTEVGKFVTGLDGLTELMLALEKLPEGSLPQAPGPKVDSGRWSTALPSFRSRSPDASAEGGGSTDRQVGGGRLKMPQLMPLPEYKEPRPSQRSASQRAQPDEPGSGSRLFDNIAKGVGDMFGGSNRQAASERRKDRPDDGTRAGAESRESVSKSARDRVKPDAGAELTA